MNPPPQRAVVEVPVLAATLGIDEPGPAREQPLFEAGQPPQLVVEVLGREVMHGDEKVEVQGLPLGSDGTKEVLVEERGPQAVAERADAVLVARPVLAAVPGEGERRAVCGVGEVTWPLDGLPARIP